MQDKFNIREASKEDLNAICELQNHHILHTDDIYSEELKSLNELKSWFEIQKKDGFPIIVAEVAEVFAGFATYGRFRKRPCYSSTVEHSVYLSSGNQGLGLGRLLIEELIEIARRSGVHAMIGGIDSKNQKSIEFHKRLGFKEVGRIPEVARKKGKWLELVMMQKVL